MDISRSHCSQCEHNDEYKKDDQTDSDMVTTLSKEKGWITEYLYQYKSFWFTPAAIRGVEKAQQCFKVQPTDILLSTFPKSGTTWFKALIFSFMNRDPSVMSSCCKIVYVFRETKDVLVSNWHHMTKLRQKELPSFPIEDVFDLFCKGVSHYGPFWDHILGYWKETLGYPDKASLENPESVLFLTYEDMKKDPIVCITKLAKFFGKPFSLEEKREGVVLFCKGASHFRPFWDHILGYWKASLENPESVLLLTYEDMKKDQIVCITKLAKFLGKPFSLEEKREGVVLFCKGASHFRPFWDHILGYWKASLENPESVIFLTYEDMKKDPIVCITKLAKFLGKPFSLEEKREGVV
ncbi:hypothetical protein RND71_018052 [Anisodus tanguticus]|uniref:Sulfotransferase n=1 Tax=Anisodus tanguticus TaxID=243964 RepID=A0AAE1S5C2_9SOLA|nr:hypothetical protein RND71_018052 [Anisodus tanguticus]